MVRSPVKMVILQKILIQESLLASLAIIYVSSCQPYGILFLAFLHNDWLSYPSIGTSIIDLCSESDYTINEMPRQSILAGHIAPFIESFMLSKDDLRAIVQNVSAILSVVDLAVLFVFGWLLVPYVRIIYNFIYTGHHIPKEKSLDKKEVSEEDEEDDEGDIFDRSYVFFISDHLSQIAKLALLVYACDCGVSETSFFFIMKYFNKIY